MKYLVLEDVVDFLCLLNDYEFDIIVCMNLLYVIELVGLLYV